MVQVSRNDINTQYVDRQVVANGAGNRAVKNDAGGNRERILEIVDRHPGLNIQEISDEIGIARTGIVHHMRQLIRERQVTTRRQGHHLLHFPARMPVLEQAALTAMRVPSLRGIIRTVFYDPTATRTDLEERIFASSRTLRRSINRLRRDDLAKVHARARPSDPFIELNPNLRTLLGRHRHLLDSDEMVFPEPKGVKAWLWLLPQAWRAFASPW